MKKLLGIVVLGLLFCNVSNAGWIETNLKGLKKFRLSVYHGSECDGKRYRKDIITNVRYLLGNSKIEVLPKDSIDVAEWLGISVTTVSSTSACSSTVQLQTYTFGDVKNSAGNTFFGQVLSYDSLQIGHSSPEKHKGQVMDIVEILVKEFVVAWIEAQK